MLINYDAPSVVSKLAEIKTQHNCITTKFKVLYMNSLTKLLLEENGIQAGNHTIVHDIFMPIKARSIPPCLEECGVVDLHEPFGFNCFHLRS